MPEMVPSDPEARRSRRAIRRAMRPLAKRVRTVENTARSSPVFVIGRVTSTSPLEVTFRPGDEGEWKITSPARSLTYAPGLTDWVLCASIGRSARLDPSHGGWVVCFAVVLGT